MGSFPETYKITAQNMNIDGINNTANTKREMSTYPNYQQVVGL